MKLDEQKIVQQRFEDMFQKGIKPWRDHAIEPLFNKFFQTLQTEKPNTKILDLGCGDGWATIYSAKKGLETWGIDSSHTAIEEAENDAQKENVVELTHFKVADVLNLPFENSFFDAIIDGGLFHHILPENRSLYFENILKVLKKEGYFYLSAFSKDTTNQVGYHFTKNEIEDLFGKYFSVVAFEKDEIHATSSFVSLHFIFKRN